jgi:hypothetical protein
LAKMKRPTDRFLRRCNALVLRVFLEPTRLWYPGPSRAVTACRPRQEYKQKSLSFRGSLSGSPQARHVVTTASMLTPNKEAPEGAWTTDMQCIRFKSARARISDQSPLLVSPGVPLSTGHGLRPTPGRYTSEPLRLTVVMDVARRSPDPPRKPRADIGKHLHRSPVAPAPGFLLA